MDPLGKFTLHAPMKLIRRKLRGRKARTFIFACIPAIGLLVGHTYSLTVDNNLQRKFWIQTPDSRVPIVLSVVIFITTTGASTWTVPVDWGTPNEIDAIGGGGGKKQGSNGDAGGGGGACSQVVNQNYTPGAGRSATVGAGGASANNGGDTQLLQNDNATVAVLAKGGQTGAGSFPVTGGP